MASAPVDPFHRAYLVATVDGSAESETVASLLEQAAERIRGLGQVDVHAISYELTDDANSPSCSLTIYYDRVERRRTARD